MLEITAKRGQSKSCILLRKLNCEFHAFYQRTYIRKRKIQNNNNNKKKACNKIRKQKKKTKKNCNLYLSEITVDIFRLCA
uniref:Uncharacterized protein n=1 Tax=Octopus bimaculoides TaxID=37653 RepID=A0A0L8GF15_OCTBM